MREIVFDTETTGLDPLQGDRMVEIGCIELINRFPSGKTFHCYFNPERDMPEPAFKVHGLSIDFLKDRKTIELPCKQCGTPIYWPPESQLQTHLGAWAEPAMCGACKRDAMEAARAVERQALRDAHPAPGSGETAPAVPEAATTEPPAPADGSANA